MSIPAANTAAAVPKPTPNAGTGLFAATNIYSGMNVCSFPNSWVAVLDTARLADTCSNCLGAKSYQAQELAAKNNAPLKTCSGCHVVRYCDKVS
jgi:SET and MYND domain-containing protein